MVSEQQLVKVYVIVTLAVVQRGQTIYLKIPKDINEASLGFSQGDNVQIGVMRITHKGRPKGITRVSTTIPEASEEREPQHTTIGLPHGNRDRNPLKES